MTITDAGLDALGPYEPLPTGGDLARYWLGHQALGKAERTALEALLHHPDGLDKDELCAATGYSFSGTFSNALGKLRTIGIITGKNTEVMHAHPDLFDQAE